MKQMTPKGHQQSAMKDLCGIPLEDRVVEICVMQACQK
jgi:hypothetical protein